MVTHESEVQIFTQVSLISLLAVTVVYITAHIGAKRALPKNASFVDRVTFIWMTFDALIHFGFEGSFLYLSTGGRTVHSSTGFLAEMWKEYAKADAKWGTADPTVVSLEYLTVLGAGPIAVYILYLLLRNDPARYYWIVVISTAELYGGWMTFCPSWLEGSPSLNTSNWLHLWVYLVFMNVLWVVIPFWLMWDAYNHIASSLKQTQEISDKRRRA